MDISAQMIDDCTIVPTSCVSELFGTAVDLDDATESLEIVK